jgi:hypothetical protein
MFVIYDGLLNWVLDYYSIINYQYDDFDFLALLLPSCEACEAVKEYV